MPGKATGAPLRAIGTLGAIWILARVISWNLPANIAKDPVGLTIGKTAFHDVAKIHNSEIRGLSELHRSAPATPRDNADKKHDIMILSYPAHRSIDPSGAERSASRRRLWLAMMQPEFSSYRLLPGKSSKRALSLSQAIEPDTPPFQNMLAKQRRNGFGGYFWVFARRASRAIGMVSGKGGAIISNGQYGGSQIGAILSYPISTRPDPELAVYGRLTAALAPLAQEEIAFGVRFHPFHNLPYSIHAEQRLDPDSGGDRGTAVYVAGGTGPDPIIEKIAFETYAQGGYVLGDNESHFFDGSATLQRPIAESGRKKLFVGAGVWAGGQRQISRLDVGPRADFRVPLGTTSARVAVDWRVRVAGHARPESGLAITVSAGF